jgi:hypothetical protein
MSTEKIDPRLLEEIEKLERSGASSRKLAVIVEPAAAAAPGAQNIDALERGVQDANAVLRQRLAQMGVTEVQQLTLAQALVADLTPPQIRTLASDPLVKRLLWNVAARVTL